MALTARQVQRALAFRRQSKRAASAQVPRPTARRLEGPVPMIYTVREQRAFYNGRAEIWFDGTRQFDVGVRLTG